MPNVMIMTDRSIIVQVRNREKVLLSKPDLDWQILIEKRLDQLSYKSIKNTVKMCNFMEYTGVAISG